MLSSLLRLLDPRRSLVTRLAWVVILLSLVLSTLIGLVVSNAAESEVESSIGSLYFEYARQVDNQLSDNIGARLRNVQVMSNLIDVRKANPDSQRNLLENFQAAYPEYSWIGLADLNGKVLAATSHLLEGQDVSKRSWFTHGKSEPFIGDVHDDAALAELLPPSPGGEPLRFIDVTAPVKNAQGQIVGVLGAHLSWNWVRTLEQNTLASLHQLRSGDGLIISAQGQVLVGPAPLIGTQLDANLYNPPPPSPRSNSGGNTHPPARHYQTTRWPDGLDYLSGWRRDDFGSNTSLGWTVLVREPASDAFAGAIQTQQRIVLFGLGLGLVSAALGAWVMQRFTRPLNQIAAAADRIQHNQPAEIPLFNNQDEVGRVSRSLHTLVNSLATRNAELLALNATLEDRVTERTDEIERLSGENELAAVARERLRVARDLHDTLAHTLAGLLMQIRLTRKVATRNPQAVADEMARAEEAAQQGLMEARAAITNLRANPVRDLGLAVALEQRLSTFAHQQNLRAQFNVDKRLPTLVNDRAETMFRIFEETLHNIEKHARATNISVSLQRQHETKSESVAKIASVSSVVMSVCDDGVGFDPAMRVDGHYGIHGMREQCDLIHARLDVSSVPGQGTRVDVTML